MSSSRYPLEAAQTVRAVKREQAVRGLAEAERRHESARRRLDEARLALKEHRQEQSARRQRIPAPARGAALRRVRAFEDAVAIREQGLLDAYKHAGRAERAAARAVREARDAVAAAHVQEKVLDHHRSRWTQAQAQKAERAEEDRREEQFLSKP